MGCMALGASPDSHSSIRRWRLSASLDWAMSGTCKPLRGPCYRPGALGSAWHAGRTGGRMHSDGSRRGMLSQPCGQSWASASTCEPGLALQCRRHRPLPPARTGIGKACRQRRRVHQDARSGSTIFFLKWTSMLLVCASGSGVVNGTARVSRSARPGRRFSRLLGRAPAGRQGGPTVRGLGPRGEMPGCCRHAATHPALPG